MGTTQTIRPSANVSGAGAFTLVGGGSTVWGNLSDASDTTRVQRTSSGDKTVVMDLDSYTLAADERVKRVRAAVRVLFNTKPLYYEWTLYGVGLPIPVVSKTRQAKNTSVTTYYTDWVDPPAKFTPPLATQADVDGMTFAARDNNSSSTNLFYDVWVELDVIDQPTVTVNTPGTSSLRPTVSWVYADGDGDSQTYYQVKVFSAAQYGAGGFDPETSTASWDSGEVALDTETASVTSSLTNSTTYKAYVKVAHDGGPEPFWSDWDDSASFALAVTTTTAPTISGGIFNEVDGRVEMTVSGAAPPGGITQTLRVEKSYDGSTWVAVRGWADHTFDSPYSETVYDYEVPADVTISYRAKALGVNATDDDVSSAWSATNTETPWTDGQWWLKCVADPSLNVSGVRVLTDPDISIDEAITVLRPLGSSKAITVVGDIYGQDGSWNIQVTEGYDDEMAKLLAVLTYQGVLLVQDPFRGFRYVRLTSRSYVPQGTGDYPRATWTVSYVEVDVPAVE